MYRNLDREIISSLDSKALIKHTMRQENISLMKSGKIILWRIIGIVQLKVVQTARARKNQEDINFCKKMGIKCIALNNEKPDFSKCPILINDANKVFLENVK
jgi:hypothetical protein